MNYLRWPLERVEVTQRFGENPATYEPMGLKGHDGIDFRTRFFTLGGILGRGNCLAARDATVELVRNDGKKGYGLHIRLRHDDGSMTIYGHLSSVKVEMKQKVVEGQVIGITGNTGKSTAPHLHFEYRPKDADPKNGYAGAIDPYPLLLNYQTMVDQQKEAQDAAKLEVDTAFTELSKEGIMKRVNEEGTMSRREIALVVYRLMLWVLKLLNK